MNTSNILFLVSLLSCSVVFGIRTGGLAESTPNDEHMNMMFDFVKEINEKINEKKESNNIYIPIKINKVSVQVVAGMLYRIEATFGESNCAKNSNQNIRDCSVSNNNSQANVYAEVWDRPWLNKKEIRNIEVTIA